MKIKKGSTIYRFCYRPEKHFEKAIANEEVNRNRKNIWINIDNCNIITSIFGWATTKEEAFDLWLDFLKNTIFTNNVKVKKLLSEIEQYESELKDLDNIDRNILDNLTVEFEDNVCSK